MSKPVAVAFVGGAATAAYSSHVAELSSVVAASSLFMVMFAYLAVFHTTSTTASELVLSRIVNTIPNWKKHFVRSYLELGSWLGAMSIAWIRTRSVPTAVCLGSLAGILVVLASDAVLPVLAARLGKLLHSMMGFDVSSKSSSLTTFNLALIYTFTLGGYHAAVMITTATSSLVPVVFLVTCASLIMVVLAEILLRFNLTQDAGASLSQRTSIANTIENWRAHPLRSTIEVTAWAGSGLMCAGCGFSAPNILQISTIIGVFAVTAADSISHSRDVPAPTGTLAPLPLRPARLKSTQQTFTMAEVAKHSSLHDMWLVIDGAAYDVSGYVKKHPGGEKIMLRFAGGEATDEILQFHSWALIEKHLRTFYRGEVTDAPVVTEIQKDFRALLASILARGYCDPQPMYYFLKLVWLVSLFVMAISLSLSSTTAIRMCGAAALGIFWQQVAFLGHDLGHMSVSYDRMLDIRIGYLLANAAAGLSGEWWKANHNVHHAVPNSLHDDPDIAYIPIFAVDKGYFDSLYHTYHRRFMPYDAVAKFLVPYQHFLYFPVMGVARFNLYVQTLIYLFSNKGGRERVLEYITLLVFYGWFGLLLSTMPSYTQLFAFLVISHFVGGLLNLQITLSHFSMPTVVGSSPEGKDVASIDPTNPGHVDRELYGGDFYTRNIDASLDVDCPVWLDWFHGGLQFQCIHHCFPRMGRPFARTMQPEFAALCAKHNLEYRRKSFFSACKHVFTQLRVTAMEAKEWSPRLGEMLNAEG